MNKPLCKTPPLLKIVNGSLIDLPSPASISIWWNMGSLLGMCLIIQILSGLFLAMHYTANIELAFNSVIHNCRDVNNGWLLRYTYVNGASLFFIYLHTGRGFSVDNATLTRLFTLHFLLSFITAAMVMIHLLFLHQTGSNNPLGVNSNLNKAPFHPYFSIKDLLGMMMTLTVFSMIILLEPSTLGDPENNIPANPLVTPVHIQPEWYFLFAYAILRSIPNKLEGVITMIASISIIMMPPITNKNKFQWTAFYSMSKTLFWSFTAVIILLTWIGTRPAEEPFIFTGQVLTVLYFLYFMINPIMLTLWDKINE